MACTDNIKAMYVLRSQLALYSNAISERARCERLVATELEDQEFLFNVLDFMGMRMCRTDAMPKLVLSFDSSYLASDPGGEIILSIQNGKSVNNQTITLTSQSSASALADQVINSLSFGLLLGGPDPKQGVYRYYKSADNEVTIVFRPGYVGSYSANYSVANSPNSYITITGDTTAKVAYEMVSMCSASGDDDRLKRIAHWFSARINTACDDPVYVANMGKCPPEDYIACDLISPEVLSFAYYEEFIPGGHLATNPLPPVTLPVVIQKSIISFADPILEIVTDDDPEITLTESITGDIYYLKTFTDGLSPNWSGDATVGWEIVSVLPFGDTTRVDAEEINPVDPDATYTWGGTLPIRTTKGNTCDLVLNNSIEGSEFYTITPAPMTLVNLTFANTRITGAYTQIPVPKPPAVITLYKDGSAIYEWVLGSDPYVTFDGSTGFDLQFPPEVGPLEEPGTYSFSWPQGWVCGKDSLALAPAVALNDFTYVVSAVPATGFPYTFDFELS